MEDKLNKIKNWLKKKTPEFYIFALLLTCSVLLIGYCIVKTIFFKEKDPIVNQQTLTFFTAGVSLSILSITSFLSLKSGESSIKRDKDLLIFETFKQNYQILDKKEDRLEQYVNEINKKSSDEWIGFYKMVKFLNETYTVSSPEREEIQNLYQENKTENYKLVRQYVLDNKKTQTEKIVFLYLRFYREKTYQLLEELNIEKQLKKSDKNNSDYIKLMKTEFFKNINNQYDNFFKENKYKYIDFKENISENIIEKYSDINYFFRHTHRVLKLLNEIDDLKVRKNYMGILRAQYSELVIVSIYLNAVYTKKGVGLAQQIKNSDFFASMEDFNTGNEMIHGAFETIFQKDKQYEIIKKIFVDSDNKIEASKLPNIFAEIFNS